MKRITVMGACLIIALGLTAAGDAAVSEHEVALNAAPACDTPSHVTVWTDGVDVVGRRVQSGQTDALKWATDDVLVTDPASDQVKPSIASDPGGELFLVVEDRDTINFMELYRSNDGGNTWSSLTRFGTNPQSRNPSLTYVDNDAGERWLVVAYEVVTSDAERRVRSFRVDPDNTGEYSFNTIEDGITWLVPTEEVHPQITSDNVAYSGSYYLYVTYAVPSIDYYPVFFSRSTDRGVTWSAPTNITGGSENTASPTRPEIAYGGAGLFVAFTKPGWNGSSWTIQTWVTKSTNFGSSWVAPVQLTSTSTARSYPAVAAAYPDDAVVVAYTAQYSSDTDVSYVASTDGGTTWSSSAALPWSLDDEGFVDLAVSRTSPGRFHAVYLHEINDIWYSWASTANPTSWSTAVTVNYDSHASGATFYPRPSVTVNSSLGVAEEVAISWSDWRNPDYGAYFDGPIAVGSLIFADGFESGNTTLWTSTTP